MTERRYSEVDVCFIDRIGPVDSGFYVFYLDNNEQIRVPEKDFIKTIGSERTVLKLAVKYEDVPYEEIKLIDGTLLSSKLEQIKKSISVTPDCNNLKFGPLSFLVADSPDNSSTGLGK